MIFPEPASGPLLGRRSRWLLVLAGCLLLGGFALARSLDPDPRGFGTHQRLGLPPCSVRFLLNVPCPSCGMTTSFAHFTRGNLGPAYRSNPGGVVLALFCMLLIPWCWYSAALGRWWGTRQPLLGLTAILLVVCGISVLHWLLQMIAL